MLTRLIEVAKLRALQAKKTMRPPSAMITP